MFKFEKIGSDPEIICYDPRTGKPISMVGTYEVVDGVSIYNDNVLLEFNHSPIAVEDFTKEFPAILAKVDTFIASKGLEWSCGQSEAVYDTDQLCHKDAHRIGCAPFLSAYDLGRPVVPPSYSTNKRFAGGHIHLSHNMTREVPPEFIVKVLDEVLYPLDTGYSDERAQTYGQKGAFRPKSYGLEYRPLSNFWMERPHLVVDAIKEVECRINTILSGGSK